MTRDSLDREFQPRFRKIMFIITIYLHFPTYGVGKHRRGTPQTLIARIKGRIAVGKYREVSARDKSERTRDYTCD